MNATPDHDDFQLMPVCIRPGVNVLSILRHVNYKPWFALAEFVDNAVQSYNLNKMRLEDLHGSGFRLKVSIDIELSTPTRIKILDNAAGIARSDFSRAFRPAAIPSDRSGLSEFGMGMKSAACWFAPRWSVRTKAIGEPVERTVRFDIDSIVRDQIEELESEQAPAISTSHFTEITLEDPYHLPVKRTVGKIKDHLTDIYRLHLVEGALELSLNGDVLSYKSPKILYAAYARNPHSPAREWRKTLSLDLGAGLSAHGFAGLMDPSNTALSGFALFRRGRLIQGSGDEGYRPKHIFGQAGSFRWRRLFGELHLEGFEVSHTKDGIKWDENEQPFIELLYDELDKQDLPLLRQADSYRAQGGRDELMTAAERAMSGTLAALESGLPQALLEVSNEPGVETDTVPLPLETAVAWRELQIDFREHQWLIRIELTNNPAHDEWLSVSDQPSYGDQRDVIQIRVSMAHPFMVNFAQTDPDQVEALLRMAAGIALSEKLARNVGVKMAKTLRRNLNELLRTALSRI